MEHLCDVSELNRLVTTITALGALVREDEPDAPPIAGNAFLRAIQCVATDAAVADIRIGARTFRNSCNLRVRVTSAARGNAERDIAIKVFKNASLQITGAHSIDLIFAACSKIGKHVAERLAAERLVPATATYRPTLRRVVMSNYKVAVPGRVDLHVLHKTLTRSRMLVIYDPAARDSAANIKVCVEGDRMCSIRVFESGKIIMSISTVADRDAALDQLLHVVNTQVKPLAR